LILLFTINTFLIIYLVIYKQTYYYLLSKYNLRLTSKNSTVER